MACSCAAYWAAGDVELLKFHGRHTMASCVCFTGDEDLGEIIGNDAKSRVSSRDPLRVRGHFACQIRLYAHYLIGK